MRIVQVSSVGVLPRVPRRHLEEEFHLDTASALRSVQAAFPQHVVSRDNGLIRVTNRDRSLSIAVFKECFPLRTIQGNAKKGNR